MANPVIPSQQTRSLRPSTIAASAKRRGGRTTARRRNATKAKRATTTAAAVVSSDYEECSTSEETEEARPSRGEFVLDGRCFRRVADIASGGRRKKTSHVWDKDKGYEIIDVKTGLKHYYCIECCDKEKDESYIPFVVKGTSNI
jgi:hypothetical protein